LTEYNLKDRIRPELNGGKTLFATIEEGLAVYEDALRTYFKHSSEIKKRYGHENVMIYGGDDFAYLITTNRKLSAMAAVLGITESEDKDIMKKIEAEFASKQRETLP
jgi:hypothetical protein